MTTKQEVRTLNQSDIEDGRRLKAAAFVEELAHRTGDPGGYNRLVDLVLARPVLSEYLTWLKGNVGLLLDAAERTAAPSPEAQEPERLNESQKATLAAGMANHEAQKRASARLRFLEAELEKSRGSRE